MWRLKERNARRRRGGHTLVLLALLITVLVGMLGLVIDGGLMMAAHRQAQNAADAAARAAAISLHGGGTSAELQSVAEAFVFTHNSVPHVPDMSNSEQVVVNHPPAAGPYQGRADYVEVIVAHPVDLMFGHILGVEQAQIVGTRAVAGFEQRGGPAGVVVLDPQGNPGLSVGGTNAALNVDAAIIVYTRREGENAFGATVGDIHAGHPAVELSGSGATMTATELSVSGGVDDADNYRKPAVGELHAGTSDPIYDPFHKEGNLLPTPDVDNGVLDRDLGDVSISNNNQTGLVLPNVHDPDTGVTTLHPGIYEQIKVTGGNVLFKEGIYVLRPRQNFGAGNILSITGGEVYGDGVMFYNTGNTYHPDEGPNGEPPGSPDVSDEVVNSDVPPSGLQGTKFGGIDIHGENVTLKPINTLDVNLDYSSMPDIDVFNKMLIYQRRFNERPIVVTDGMAPPDGLQGRFYAKWAELRLSGQGTYNFSIVAGSLGVSGQATITVQDLIPVEPRVEPVRLVE